MPLIGDRGPEYQGLAGNWSLRSGATGTGSNTLRIFGQPGRWRGNLAWNDGRVAILSRPDPNELKFAFGGGTSVNDNIFVNENDSNGAQSFEQNPGLNANTLLRPYSDVQAPGSRRSDARITTFID